MNLFPTMNRCAQDSKTAKSNLKAQRKTSKTSSRKSREKYLNSKSNSKTVKSCLTSPNLQTNSSKNIIKNNCKKIEKSTPPFETKSPNSMNYSLTRKILTKNICPTSHKSSSSKIKTPKAKFP